MTTDNFCKLQIRSPLVFPYQHVFELSFTKMEAPCSPIRHVLIIDQSIDPVLAKKVLLPKEYRRVYVENHTINITLNIQPVDVREYKKHPRSISAAFFRKYFTKVNDMFNYRALADNNLSIELGLTLQLYSRTTIYTRVEDYLWHVDGRALRRYVTSSGLSRDTSKKIIREMGLVGVNKKILIVYLLMVGGYSHGMTGVSSERTLVNRFRKGRDKSKKWDRTIDVDIKNFIRHMNK